MYKWTNSRTPPPPQPPGAILLPSSQRPILNVDRAPQVFWIWRASISAPFFSSSCFEWHRARMYSFIKTKTTKKGTPTPTHGWVLWATRLILHSNQVWRSVSPDAFPEGSFKVSGVFLSSQPQSGRNLQHDEIPPRRDLQDRVILHQTRFNPSPRPARAPAASASFGKSLLPSPSLWSSGARATWQPSR